MTTDRLACLLLASLLAGGCAAKKVPEPNPRAAPIALEAARAALRDAEAAQAQERAPQTYERALEYLRQAEAGSGSAAEEAAIRAEGSARLAAAESRCATSASASPSNGATLERAQAELKRVREENRRLEERVTLLHQTLEQTETELIRARQRGIETKAEASSAIAEARILMRRLGTRSAAYALCQDSLAKAEKQLAAENYGAAMAFALRAQDTANRTLAAQPR